MEGQGIMKKKQLFVIVIVMGTIGVLIGLFLPSEWPNWAFYTGILIFVFSLISLLDWRKRSRR